MWPTLLSLGDFHLATYGVLVAAGFLAGILYFTRQPEVRELGEAKLQNLITGIFVSGMSGGKLLYLMLYWREMNWAPADWIGNLRFGFVYFGGFLGALGFGTWYARRHSIDFWKYCDLAVVGLAIGHGIGRLGCFAAGCCYGGPTPLPWGISFRDAEALIPGHLIGVPLHPAQLYEAFGDFVIAAALHFAVLPKIRSGRWREGSAALGYMLLYSVLRFAVECVRADDRGFYALGLSVSQWVSVSLILASSALLFRRHQRGS